MKVLEISNGDKIGDKSLEFILKQCESLSDLTVKHCKKVKGFLFLFFIFIFCFYFLFLFVLFICLLFYDSYLIVKKRTYFLSLEFILNLSSFLKENILFSSILYPFLPLLSFLSLSLSFLSKLTIKKRRCN